MASVPTVPMIAPNGESGEIPQNRMQDAMNAGFKPAVPMVAPDGSTGWIPQDRVQEAIQKGNFKTQVNPKIISALTANPDGEGTYDMTTPDGRTISVPYSQVPVATGMQGYAFNGGSGAQYEKDAAADPHRPTFWNALTNPVGAGGQAQGVLGAVEQAGGQAIKTMAQPLIHPIDTVKGAAKAAGYVGGNLIGLPDVPDEWNPITGMRNQFLADQKQGGTTLALENLLGSVGGMIEGGRAMGAVAEPAVRGLLRATGRGLQGGGEGLAESALGVRNTDRAFDANPGRAILDETTGFKPSTIADEAQERLADLAIERAQLAKANPGPVNFAPARQVAADAMQEQALRNAIPQINRMAPLAEQMRTQGEPSGGWPIGVRPPRPAGRPIPPFVETPEALNLREGVGNYAADKPWTGKASADPLRGMVRGVYGSMSDSIHNTVPEIAPIDAAMHDLIPVAQRAGETDLNASTLQRVAGRFSRPTGALTAGVAGGAEGFHLAGVPGAVAGGIAGLVTPEILADPAVQMAIARAADRVGNAAQGAAPLAAAGAGAAARAVAASSPSQSPSADVSVPITDADRMGPNGNPNFYSDAAVRARRAFYAMLGGAKNENK